MAPSMHISADFGHGRHAAGGRGDEGGDDFPSKSLALTLAPKNIRVNCVSPGSEFPGGQWDQRKRDGSPLYEAIRTGIPFQASGDPAEETAAAVVFCPAPASWVSGVNLPGGRRTASGQSAPAAGLSDGADPYASQDRLLRSNGDSFGLGEKTC